MSMSNIYSIHSYMTIQSRVSFIIGILILILLLWSYQLCSTSSSVASPHRHTINNECQQSLSESGGFFCESNFLWNERKLIYHHQDQENLMKRPNSYYFLNNWEPNFHCSHLRRIGAMGDGGKWVCDVHRLRSRHDCLIYSVGSHGDFSFENELKKLVPNCEIHVFDKDRYICPTNTCDFHQITFGNGIQPNNSKDWLAVLQVMNHSNRFIDILKIDIEGGEFLFLPLLFKANVSSWPRQMLVEVHPTNVTLIHEFFELLRKNYYTIFSKENNIEAGPYFFEFSFLKLNPPFFIKPIGNNALR